MMSPPMIKELVHSSKLNENEISKRIFIPCLQKISMRTGYSLKDIKFTGGASEKGVDIQYYESVGPDKHRLYTGIQIKKKDITQNDATELMRQGSQAFGKDIIDASTGVPYRFNRWIIAATGKITQPAQDEIYKELSRYGKLISFWDGTRIAEFILDNYYEEFIKELNINPVLAGSSNVTINWWDPDKPLVIAEKFDKNNWETFDLSKIAPVMADGIFISIAPLDKNIPSVKCAIRTSIDEIVIDSVMSQISPYMIKLERGKLELEIMLIGDYRPVRILNRGTRFII